MLALPAPVGRALSFAGWLRQSRTLRELSLDEVAAQTRLPRKSIEALESGDYAALADRAYALLVARACAAAIGLDPDETALRLEEELQRLEVPKPPVTVWQRALRAAPRDPWVWLVLAATLIACAALLVRR